MAIGGCSGALGGDSVGGTWPAGLAASYQAFVLKYRYLDAKACPLTIWANNGYSALIYLGKKGNVNQIRGSGSYDDLVGETVS